MSVAPAQPAYPDPWAANSDPKFNGQPELLTYNRFFQHTMKFLADNKMFDEVVFTLGRQQLPLCRDQRLWAGAGQLHLFGGVAMHWL